MSFNEQYNKAMEKIFEKYKNVDADDEENFVDLNDPIVDRVLEKGIENTKILNQFEKLYENLLESWEECYERVVGDECMEESCIV